MENNINTLDSNSLQGKDFYVALAPHLKSSDSTQRIMLDVIIALVPALIGSIYFFGIRAALLIAVCIVSCVASEYVFQKLAKKPILIHDLTSVVTGILIAFNLPSEMPLWMASFGSIFAIVVVKECFGGVGQNFMNPALAGRIVLMASWAKAMTAYTFPKMVIKNSPEIIKTGATPLQLMKAGSYENLPALKDMFIGSIGGVLGETSALLLIIGGLYLVIRKVINIEIPIIFVATTAVILALLGIPVNVIPYELLGGGLMLGAIFMATDYSSSPINKRGRIIFAIGCGLITAIIRVKGSLPEGVSYAICLMNVATPVIDRLTRTEAYGEAK